MILGDFSSLTYCMRLYAGKQQDVFDVLPDVRDRTVEDVQRDMERRPWNDDPLPLIYLANFVHELTHLVQFTTRYALIMRTSAMHNMAGQTVKFLHECRRIGEWPPRLPLIRWRTTKNSHAHDEFTQMVNILGFSVAIREGAANLLELVRHRMDLGELDSEAMPFHPTIDDLELSIESRRLVGSGYELSVEMLLEGEATFIETRYMGFWCGAAGAVALEWQTAGGTRMDPRYHLIPSVALLEGLDHILPVLMDWAFQGPLHATLPLSNKLIEYPTHRFVNLFNAATPYRGISAKDLLTHYPAILSHLERLTGYQAPVAMLRAGMENVSRIWWDPWLKVATANVGYRLRQPEAFYYPEIGVQALWSQLAVPQVLFRNDEQTRLHNGACDKVLGQSETDELWDQGLDFWEALLMAFEPSITCPFCDTERYGGIPNVGARPGPVEHGVEQCRCGWKYRFRKKWGVHFNTIQPVDSADYGEAT